MTVATVKLSQLRLSPLNVRTGKAPAIESLAQDIAAHGIIQSLSVYEEGGKYHVFAGGRRFRALQRLQKEKTIGGSYEVPVIIRSIEEAHELSLSENVAREAMHVADCVIAYGKLRDEFALEAEQIALRFGVAVDYVRRVLKLSALAPSCLALLAKDEISLRTAQALTLTDDHEVQEQLVKQYGDSDWQIKKALTISKLDTSNSLFQFVGAEAYAEAGGSITRDLFNAKDEGFADSPELLMQLATSKLDRLADEASAEGWQKIQTGFERPDCYYSKPQVRTDEDGHYSDEVKVSAELFIFIGYNGETQYAAFGSKGKAGSSGAGGVKTPKADWSASLVHDLSVTRTMTLQQRLAEQPQVAFDLLLATLVEQMVFDGSAHSCALSFDVRSFALRGDDALTGETFIEPVYVQSHPAVEQMEGPGIFEAIRQMDEATKMDVLAHAVAQMLNGVNDGYGHDRLRKVDAVAQAVDLDMAKHWTVTPHLFERAGKGTTLKILTEQCGEQVAANVSKLKKAELAAVAVQRLEGSNWLPPEMMVKEWPEPETTDQIDDEMDDDFDDEFSTYDDEDFSEAA
jgi:ParB family chromosome partitioning protein